MTLRPWKRLKQYQQLVEALNRRIDQGKQIDQLHEEHIAALSQRLDQETKLTALWKDIADQLKKQPTEKVKMPLPTAEAVEGLVSAFFDGESVIIAREALELTRNLAPMGPQDVKATNLCLMKLWRHYAMRKVEQAAKQDVL